MYIYIYIYIYIYMYDVSRGGGQRRAHGRLALVGPSVRPISETKIWISEGLTEAES